MRFSKQNLLYPIYNDSTERGGGGGGGNNHAPLLKQSVLIDWLIDG